MALVALAVWCFIVALAGGLVGLVLGNLRLPLMLLVASSPAAGAGANLVVSAVSAATAAITHVRAGRINWRLVAWMAPPSIAAAVIGGWLAGEVPRRALLLGIAAVLLFSGIQLLRRPERATRGDGGGLDIRAAVLSGAGIGLLGGFVGLILGSLRMPALLRMVGEVPARAVGTNVTIGAGVGVAGALGHGFSVAPDLTAAAVGAAASIPGALLGARLTGRLSEPQLVRAIGIVLLVAGLATGLEAL
ncbi:MAG: sulfite exporter TauE/SafE family protein [Solirubrobacteraceae bacterium]